MGFGSVLNTLCLFGLWLLLPGLSSSHPLCTDSTAPFTPKVPLTFCQPYGGSVCCNSTKDLELQGKFQSMNIADPTCASLMKSILCATCDQFSAQLFDTGYRHRSVPVLCNSNISVGSTQSNSAANNFCGQVWNTCQNVSTLNSPFDPSHKYGCDGVPGDKSTSSKLTDHWKSECEFCNEFGGASRYDSVCFDGEPVTLNATTTVNPPNGLCLEKVSNGNYINMVGHPDGSNRVFITDQPGRIWLATVPDMNSGGTLVIQSPPFLDISDKVYVDYELGLMGLAFHPDFMENGRFFVSFNCDSTKWNGCSGGCSCNSNANCNPSDFTAANGFPPCRFYAVISEFNANNGSTSTWGWETYSLATQANQTEVRRIFSMGLPYTSDHGGQLLFGPLDGYLYYMMGDGGNNGGEGGGIGDPYNFAQNKKSLLGKIMRMDVDNFPSATQINELGLWGNYSIPRDNPFSEDNLLLPEIWALGLKNPWRCAFDQARPSYFLCANDGEDRFEMVDLITKGGNYGWRVYEGPYLYNPPISPPGGNTPPSSINPIFPVMGYDHSSLINNIVPGGAAIIGGYYYRSMSDPCMYGRYIYADYFGQYIWAGTENPENSGNFTSNQIPFSCANDSPITCSFKAGNLLPLGFLNSFGEDNNKDVYIFATNGAYKIVNPSRCNYVCSNTTSVAVPSWPWPKWP